LAFDAGITTERRYSARSLRVGQDRSSRQLQVRVDETGRVCAPLAKSAGASRANPTYVVLEIAARAAPLAAGPARFHVYQRGPRDYLVAGLERLPGD
jgi:hypothetical protein